MSKLFSRFSKGKTTDPAPSAALGPGLLIHDRYLLEQEIGRGGMGIVYRGQDRVGGRTVAIKVANPSTADVTAREKFAREADISARLDHPHIVAVYETGSVDLGAQGSWPYLVMEYVQGTTLEEIHSLTYACILDIGKQICEGLEYAHRQGYIYRDLKPGNVLIDRRSLRPLAKLTDFGIAQPRGTLPPPDEHYVEGSLFYLAPELIAGQPADIRSDLYALGGTLYKMITGRVPFSDFDRDTVLTQHLASPVTPPSQSRADLPPALEAIVLRLLEKNPADRFASAREVGAALEQVQLSREGEPDVGNLPPAEPGRFEEEIAEIRRLLGAHSLVTLLGDSGRLAIAAGTQLGPDFPNGAWYVDMETIPASAQVAAAVATALGVPADPGRSLTVSLVDHLHEKSLLLLLIHCDRFPGAVAQLIETLLPTCPDVRILAASRQPLNLPTEKTYLSSLKT